MASRPLTKRAKYKTTIKDPGTPGTLRMVLNFSFFFFIIIDLLIGFQFDRC